jgi:hypothetical protein
MIAPNSPAEEVSSGIPNMPAPIVVPETIKDPERTLLKVEIEAVELFDMVSARDDLISEIKSPYRAQNNQWRKKLIIDPNVTI